MSAGITSQTVAGTKLAIAPTVFAALLAAALLVGGVLGVVTKSGFDSITARSVAGQAAVQGVRSTPLDTRGAQITVGRGPLMQDLGPEGAASRAASHATDHIGVTERLFPVTSRHPIAHGPLR
jgi:hypothetical protein